MHGIGSADRASIVGRGVSGGGVMLNLDDTDM